MLFVFIRPFVQGVSLQTRMDDMPLSNIFVNMRLQNSL